MLAAPDAFAATVDAVAAPYAGERIDKGNTVEIDVSTGKPKVTVPGVIGDQATDAVAVQRHRVALQRVAAQHRRGCREVVDEERAVVAVRERAACRC